jgi:hypothetical protein
MEAKAVEDKNIHRAAEALPFCTSSEARWCLARVMLIYRREMRNEVSRELDSFKRRS